jgi:hypothetical protein
MVYNSYLKVMDKDGGAGIDKQSIEQFNENMRGNLYKILVTVGVLSESGCRHLVS